MKIRLLLLALLLVGLPVPSPLSAQQKSGRRTHPAPFSTATGTTATTSSDRGRVAASATNGATLAMQPFDLTSIPRIMRDPRLNWPKAATLMEKWFSRPSTIRPQYSATDTTTITMDWVLKFPRAKTVYDDMVREKVWVNQAAQKEIKKLMKEKGFLVDAKNVFNRLGQPAEKIKEDQTQFRQVAYDLNVPPDELVGALGRFTFYVVVAGSIAPSTPPRRRGHLVTISEVGIFVSDSYDFNDILQPLGCWNPKPPFIKFVEGAPGWECVFNGTFREYRNSTGKGGDFLIFSEVRRTVLSTPDTFLIPQEP